METDPARTRLEAHAANALRRARGALRWVGRRIADDVLRPPLSPFRRGGIVMFHIGRSGSRLLGNLMGQHPDILWDGEVLKPKRLPARSRGGLPDPYVHLRKRMRRSGLRYYGCETKAFHLRRLDIELESYISGIEALGFNHIIVLERDNHLRKIVSSMIAHRTSKWHLRPGQVAALNPIAIDVEHVRIDGQDKPLLAFLEDYASYFGRLETLLQGRRSLRLSYERDLAGDPLVGYRRACEFLGLQPHPVGVRYARTNPFQLRELVTNYAELEQTLEGTPYAWMLERDA